MFSNLKYYKDCDTADAIHRSPLSVDTDDLLFTYPSCICVFSCSSGSEQSLV